MIKQGNYPTTILHGPGAVGEFAKRLAAQKPGTLLLVTDAGVVKAGLADKVEKALTGAGLKVVRTSEVHPNPTEADCEAGAALVKKSKVKAIVALGGGSPMDAAKGIAVLATHPGPISRYDDGKGGDVYLTEPMPPIYAIPTTAGTGSEVGRAGVILARDTGLKTIVFHPTLLPRIAVLDPELTVGLPPSLTAATGIDAMTHGLEAYLAKGFHPMADAIALGCIETVIASLPRAVEHGNDLDARGMMLIAASMGATSFQKGLGVIHALAHPLSAHYGTHHGLANALLMPRALAWQVKNKRAAFTDDLRARYERLVRLFPGYASAGYEALPEAVGKFIASVGIRGHLGEHGLVEKDLAVLSKEAHGDPSMGGNAIELHETELAAIYRECMRGA